MKIYIEVVKLCNEVLDYVLFYGLLGFGKMIFVNIVVNELGVNLCIILGLVIEWLGDLVVLLMNL